MNIVSTTSKGQVTIPIQIRRKLGIEPGTRVRFVEREGVVVIERVERDVTKMFGLLTAKHPISDAQAREAITAEAVRRAGR